MEKISAEQLQMVKMAAFVDELVKIAVAHQNMDMFVTAVSFLPEAEREEMMKRADELFELSGWNPMTDPVPNLRSYPPAQAAARPRPAPARAPVRPAPSTAASATRVAPVKPDIFAAFAKANPMHNPAAAEATAKATPAHLMAGLKKPGIVDTAAHAAQTAAHAGAPAASWVSKLKGLIPKGMPRLALA